MENATAIEINVAREIRKIVTVQIELQTEMIAALSQSVAKATKLEMIPGSAEVGAKAKLVRHTEETIKKLSVRISQHQSLMLTIPHQ